RPRSRKDDAEKDTEPDACSGRPHLLSVVHTCGRGDHGRGEEGGKCLTGPTTAARSARLASSKWRGLSHDQNSGANGKPATALDLPVLPGGGARDERILPVGRGGRFRRGAW